MSVTGGIRSYKQLIKSLEDTRGKSETVIKRLMSDVRTRAPGWVATEVAKEYGVKKAEIRPSKTGSSGNTAGSIKVTGERIDAMQIVYNGRVLTPTHFGMSPKAPGSGAYTLKAEILKGKKAVLGKVKKLTKKQRANIGKNFKRQGSRSSSHSPIMLMRTGGTYIPFQRKSQRRNDIEAIKTVSLPQMVSSDRTSDAIAKAINDGLEKRMAQHMKLLER